MSAQLAEAREELPAGPWNPDGSRAVATSRLGVLLVHGLLLRYVHVGELTAASLVLPGDPIDARAPAAFGHGVETVTWSVVEPTTIVGLGDRFLGAARRWPALTVGLSRSHTHYAQRLACHAAMTQLPRVEQRIIAMFSALAEERGRVTPEGIRIDVDFTHATIGCLVGARRPSVSLAVKVLADERLLVRREGGGWLVAQEAMALRPTWRSAPEALVAAG